MIDQSLINRVELALNTQGVYISKGDIKELLDNYKSLIEQNAELHKSKVPCCNFNNGVKCSDIPNNLAM